MYETMTAALEGPVRERPIRKALLRAIAEAWVQGRRVDRLHLSRAASNVKRGVGTGPKYRRALVRLCRLVSEPHGPTTRNANCGGECLR
jgi:hypothetical protein